MIPMPPPIMMPSISRSRRDNEATMTMRDHLTIWLTLLGVVIFGCALGYWIAYVL